MTDQFEVKMEKEWTDDQLVYEIVLPMNPPQSKDSEETKLSLWCREETEDTFSIRYRLEPDSRKYVQEYFEHHLSAPYSGTISGLINSLYVALEKKWYPGTQDIIFIFYLFIYRTSLVC